MALIFSLILVLEFPPFGTIAILISSPITLPFLGLKVEKSDFVVKFAGITPVSKPTPFCHNSFVTFRTSEEERSSPYNYTYDSRELRH